jgi:hypothetical protein
MTTTTTRECRAINKAACRYHGATHVSYLERVEEKFHTLSSQLEETTDIQDRYTLSEKLEEASVEYAATDSGQEFFANQIAETDDWTEKEKYQQLLEDGERLRTSVEDKREGVSVFPASKLDEAIHRVDIANRKLARAGIEERFDYEVEHFIETDLEGRRFDMVRMSLTHPELHVGGWDFVAAVDKADDGAMLTRVIPGKELNGYAPEHFECDHCGSNRRRSSTYLLRNKETGEYKQVGSNCLESFSGVRPKALWALNYDPEEDDSYLDTGERRWGSRDSMLPTKSVVAAALAISDNGEKYRSRMLEQETGQDSTASEVKSFFFSSNNDNRYNDINIDDHEAAAASMIETTHFDTDNDYGRNMKTLLSQEYVSYKHVGYVVSVIAAAKKQQARQERESRPRAQGYAGQIGDKLKNVPVTVKQAKLIPTYIPNVGDSYKTLLVMTTDDGKELKWWASGEKDFKAGDMLTVTSATIKDLDTFNGDEQTVITRARVASA